MNLNNYLLECQKRVNESLNNILPSIFTEPCDLHRAMRYAVNGGKRLRSVFIYAIGQALDADNSILDKCAAAVELLHAFSLVHDDLPAIDNANRRRGAPSCHVTFGEATAILTGDALLVLSFEALSDLNKHFVSATNNLKMIKILSHYVGSLGMAGGEMLDTALKDHEITIEKLAFIYQLKTSYLICASILLGALAANCTEKEILNNLEKFGLYLGLAFQIHDDIIDIESDSETLGKPQGSDLKNHKPTYPQLIGIEQAKIKAQECLGLAMHYLQKTGINDAKILALIKFVTERRY
jgi:geranylgeranyl pyrophosphate synthase